jgi:two-component system, response regulator PdtaR
VEQARFAGMVQFRSPEELSSSEASMVEDEPFLDMADAGDLQDKPVVLVVEDELLVRILQVDILREAGFRVAEAQDADEAFEMLRRRVDVRVVLTDVDMPGSLNGFEFARLVKQGWPELQVLVISGKTAPGPGDLPQGVAFVAKPIRPATLVRLIGELTSAADQI